MEILFLQTGGTIDKDYPRATGGWAFEFGEPATKRILEKLNPGFTYQVETVCQKDSQEINLDDREEMIKQCLANTAEKIIITHGTDTLLESARFLVGKCPGKTLVFTGAMRPERFANSDAPINLGMAIAGVQVLSPGVYVCMHGWIKPAMEMQRNLENGQFF